MSEKYTFFDPCNKMVYIAYIHIHIHSYLYIHLCMYGLCSSYQVVVGAAQYILSKSAKYPLFDPCKEIAYSTIYIYTFLFVYLYMCV